MRRHVSAEAAGPNRLPHLVQHRFGFCFRADFAVAPLGEARAKQLPAMLKATPPRVFASFPRSSRVAAPFVQAHGDSLSRFAAPLPLPAEARQEPHCQLWNAPLARLPACDGVPSDAQQFGQAPPRESHLPGAS